MIDVRFVFLPTPRDLLYRSAGFTSTYSSTLKLLDKELTKLRAKNVIIQAGFDAVRMDGWPYASARPKHPGVILQFTQSGAADVITFRGVRYNRFEDNLRAIALSMEALRAVERYGIVEGQQYRGFKALPAPAAQTREEKIAALAQNGATPGERDAAEAALKRLNANPR